MAEEKQIIVSENAPCNIMSSIDIFGFKIPILVIIGLILLFVLHKGGYLDKTEVSIRNRLPPGILSAMSPLSDRRY